MYLDSLINDHFQAYVGGSRFVNPIFYSLSNEVLSVCISVARMYREVVVIVSLQKNGPHTLRFFLHRYCGRTRIEFIHFHVLVMQSFQNLQVVTRQQVEEFARRLIFPSSVSLFFWGGGGGRKVQLSVGYHFQHKFTLIGLLVSDKPQLHLRCILSVGT